MNTIQHPPENTQSNDSELKSLINRLQDGKLSQKQFWRKLNRDFFSQLNPWSKWKLLQRVEAALGLRPFKIALFDHTLQIIGGGQKYGVLLAQTLKDRYNLTLIVNKDLQLSALEQWYQIDLSGIEIRKIILPFYEERNFPLIDPAVARSLPFNPFRKVSLASMDYDLLINNSMLEMVFPLAPLSVMIVHFPERSLSRFFYADYYQQIICNSQYTAGWIARRWNLSPQVIISPPIEKRGVFHPEKKRKLILSVARFEPGGTKKQLLMLEAFRELLQKPNSEGWKFVLAGGSIPDNPYLKKVLALAAQLPKERVEVLTNISPHELNNLYEQASIFWHFCGLGEKNPANIEHFGMSTLEAMSLGVVPIVFNGGGQKEVVRDRINGFLFNNLNELLVKTQILLKNNELYKKLQQEAVRSAEEYSTQNFQQKINAFFSELINRYLFKDETT